VGSVLGQAQYRLSLEEALRARSLATGAAAIAAALVVQLAGAPFASADPESGPVTQKTVAALQAYAERDAQWAAEAAADAARLAAKLPAAQTLATSSEAAAVAAEAKAATTGKASDIAKAAKARNVADSAANALAKAKAASDAAAALSAKLAAEAAEGAAKAQREAVSLAGLSEGTATEGTPSVANQANSANGVVKSDNIEWVGNSRGTNGNFAGANFIHYERLGYDFLFGDGTGGLSIFSLKDPAKPQFVSAVTAEQLRQPGDTTARFYEGENMTVDSRRKLVYLARDPRSFGNTRHPTGRTGLYIIDVKDPWKPVLVNFHWVPAGHTATCINDCRFIWSMGPANNGSGVNGAPQNLNGGLEPTWRGVPVFATDVRDVDHPYTYATPVDLNRNNGVTDYTHSADVDMNGVAWTSGFGGVRGFHTDGTHYDPVRKVRRQATAFDPIPYAGGTTPSPDLAAQVDHNAYHSTQQLGDFDRGDLLFITMENTVNCTSTSGGGAGKFVVADISKSYGGEDWLATQENKFFIDKVGEYTPKGQPGENPTSGCSAHWFTVTGNMVAIAFYGQGTRILDLSDPTKPAQVAHLRVPAQPATATTPAVNQTNASATYWHNGYVYVADYTRGIDVLKYSGPMNGKILKKVCWNVCDQ
jgi:hypothetical protein